jgi:tRNA A-37 threonylcarbamoyl transferase component Bud32
LVTIDKEKKLVRKTITNRQDFAREIEVYEKRLSITPTLILAEFPILTISYIDGMTIGEMSTPNFHRIGEIYALFHSQTKNGDKCLCHGDCNPKNIMFSNEMKDYFLLDFSEAQMNFPESDALSFLLFWSSIQTEHNFRQTCGDFLSSYEKRILLEKELCLKMLPKLIQDFDCRRERFSKKERSRDNSVSVNRNHLASMIG